jgi:hypothetical protein
MEGERYKEAMRVVDSRGNVYDVQRFVTVIGGREGASFYRLPDGTAIRRVEENDFEIGLNGEVRARRI